MENSFLKNYKKKLKLLDKYNKFYYQNQKPLISDKKYDELKSEILELERKYSLTNPKSPSTRVGYKPSKKFEKFKHKVKMLSLYVLLYLKATSTGTSPDSFSTVIILL